MDDLTNSYQAFLKAIKTQITAARNQAVRLVNRELINLYWNIGQRIVEKQAQEGWGKSVVQQLASDLSQTFPDAKGFSAQNLWFMRQFYLTYHQSPNLQQLVREIPWGHNILIMSRIEDRNAQGYYLRQSAALGWSRNVLLNQIKADAYGKALTKPQTNFNQALPDHLAAQADETIKSHYLLDFLGITEPVLERDLERRLLQHMRSFLLELGYGFAFIGSQYRLTLGDKEYFLDLLFYHRPLRCLVALELKTGEFKPEYAGKMNFYLGLLDEQEKLAGENPSIGIILCAEKDDLEVEYALRVSNRPMGVAEYTLTNRLPSDLSHQLPSAQELKDAVKRLKAEGL
jgi:predicted nuclease of restriction endonuclease-like (RecB) superfamily